MLKLITFFVEIHTLHQQLTMLSSKMRLHIVWFMLWLMEISVKERQICVSAQIGKNVSALTQNLFTIAQTNWSRLNPNPTTLPSAINQTTIQSALTNSTMHGVNYNLSTTKVPQNGNASTSQMALATTVAFKSRSYLTGMTTTTQTDKIIQLRMGFLMANGIYFLLFINSIPIFAKKKMGILLRIIFQLPTRR